INESPRFESAFSCHQTHPPQRTFPRYPLPPRPVRMDHRSSLSRRTTTTRRLAENFVAPTDPKSSLRSLTTRVSILPRPTAQWPAMVLPRRRPPPPSKWDIQRNRPLNWRVLQIRTPSRSDRWPPPLRMPAPVRVQLLSIGLDVVSDFNQQQQVGIVELWGF